MPTLGIRELDPALRDIALGDGNELAWQSISGRLRPPSLHSAYGSCLLALNTFAPWRLDPSSLEVDGDDGFAELRHECKLPIFSRGRAPNLDVVLSDGRRVVAIESKLTEHLAPHGPGEFKPSYARAIAEAASGWQDLFARLSDGSESFTYLDARQLVRHYLGMRSQVSAGGGHEGKRAKLIYLYWEPTDGDELEVVRAHRAEVDRLVAILHDPSFATLTYAELLKAWRARGAPEWLDDHVAQLEARYVTTISTAA
ncbi:MAG: hypothetical protein M3364_09860 [Actinomycetota bacterium]|nr:hypothetical protein [Actinomycetota bacterium]